MTMHTCSNEYYIKLYHIDFCFIFTIYITLWSRSITSCNSGVFSTTSTIYRYIFTTFLFRTSNLLNLQKNKQSNIISIQFLQSKKFHMSAKVHTCSFVNALFSLLFSIKFIEPLEEIEILSLFFRFTFVSLSCGNIKYIFCRE